VMPNHVHVVFQPLAEHKLSAILHAWKSYSAKEANRILRRSGDFWQREYYDHLIRDERDLQRCIRYVLDNPKKASLKDWPWVGAEM
jgi:REP element-mobilizing transposase RayT